MIKFKKYILVCFTTVLMLYGCATGYKVIVNMRSVEIDKIDDQTVLAKIALDDHYPLKAREFAIQRLTDQAALEKILLGDNNYLLRREAVCRLTKSNQTLLTKLAMEDRDNDVQIAAIERLTDQALLYNIATMEYIKELNFHKNYEIDAMRVAAVKGLTNQTTLTYLATNGMSTNVRLAAIKLLTDQYELDEIAISKDDRCFRLAAINKLEGSNQILIKLAGNTKEVTRDAIECCARMKLAIQEQRIKSRFPNLHCFIFWEQTSRLYTSNMSIFKSRIEGEKVSIDLIEDTNMIASSSWITSFPLEFKGYFRDELLVYGENLLKMLLHMNIFTSEDLEELSYSNIPEIRIGAVANLSDLVFLSKIVNSDQNSDVRTAATKRINELTGKLKTMLR